MFASLFTFPLVYSDMLIVQGVIVNSKYFWHVTFVAYHFQHYILAKSVYTDNIAGGFREKPWSATALWISQTVWSLCDKLQAPVKHWSSYDTIYVGRDKLLIRKAKQIIISCHFLLWTIQLHLCNCWVRATSSAHVLTNTSQLRIFSTTALHLILLLVCAHSTSFYWSAVICPTS